MSDKKQTPPKAVKPKATKAVKPKEPPCVAKVNDTLASRTAASITDHTGVEHVIPFRIMGTIQYDKKARGNKPVDVDIMTSASTSIGFVLTKGDAKKLEALFNLWDVDQKATQNKSAPVTAPEPTQDWGEPKYHGLNNRRLPGSMVFCTGKQHLSLNLDDIKSLDTPRVPGASVSLVHILTRASDGKDGYEFSLPVADADKAQEDWNAYRVTFPPDAPVLGDQTYNAGAMRGFVPNALPLTKNMVSSDPCVDAAFIRFFVDNYEPKPYDRKADEPPPVPYASVLELLKATYADTIIGEAFDHWTNKQLHSVLCRMADAGDWGIIGAEGMEAQFFGWVPKHPAPQEAEPPAEPEQDPDDEPRYKYIGVRGGEPDTARPYHYFLLKDRVVTRKAGTEMFLEIPMKTIERVELLKHQFVGLESRDHVMWDAAVTFKNKWALSGVTYTMSAEDANKMVRAWQGYAQKASGYENIARRSGISDTPWAIIHAHKPIGFALKGRPLSEGSYAVSPSAVAYHGVELFRKLEQQAVDTDTALKYLCDYTRYTKDNEGRFLSYRSLLWQLQRHQRDVFGGWNVERLVAAIAGAPSDKLPPLIELVFDGIRGLALTDDIV